MNGEVAAADQGTMVWLVCPPRIASLALALLAPTAVAAQASCTAETYTTVCRSGARELRIIRNTISPSGQYGVAWEVPRDGGLEERVVDGAADGSRTAGRPDGTKKSAAAVSNFLVRLSDGTPIRKLVGEYPGDRPFYNHREIEVTWSADDRYVAVLNQGKWTTEVSEVYAVGDAASKPVSLVSVCKSATRAEVARRRRKAGDEYLARVSVSSIGNDGTITAKCSMEMIKKDNFGVGVRVNVAPERNGLKARLIEARLCGEDDERGSCATRQPQD